jgi:hypothetical protein
MGRAGAHARHVLGLERAHVIARPDTELLESVQEFLVTDPDLLRQLEDSNLRHSTPSFNGSRPASLRPSKARAPLDRAFGALSGGRSPRVLAHARTINGSAPRHGQANLASTRGDVAAGQPQAPRLSRRLRRRPFVIDGLAAASSMAARHRVLAHARTRIF